MHQQIPLLLAKSALSWWMYPIAQTTLSPTPSHPWVPPEWPYCQQAQCGCWFTVKHSKAGLQTSSHPQHSASHLLGLQGLQQTPACLFMYTYHSEKHPTWFSISYCIRLSSFDIGIVRLPHSGAPELLMTVSKDFSTIFDQCRHRRHIWIGTLFLTGFIGDTNSNVASQWILIILSI